MYALHSFGKYFISNYSLQSTFSNKIKEKVATTYVHALFSSDFFTCNSLPQVTE